jgi:hypothetical protein
MESSIILRITALVCSVLLISSNITAQTCSCTEYIYVNEVGLSTGGRVHKFSVASSGIIAEVGGALGTPWYPGTGASELPNPHGLGTDLNGRLYIGSNFTTPNTIRRLNCDGVIAPSTEFATASPGFLLSNINSYRGAIYSNGNDRRIYQWNPCSPSGTLPTGYIQLDETTTDWGFYIDKNGKFYVTTQNGKIYAFTPTAADFTANTTYSPIIDLGANPTYVSPAYSGTGLQGITTDNAGNMYVVEGDRDILNTSSRLLKFTASGAFVAAGAIDNDGTNNAGWNQMTGIVYSATANKLYTTSLNPGEDCVYRWNTDLTSNGAAVGPVPSIGQAKAIGILNECCPAMLPPTLSKSICGPVGTKVFLNQEAFRTCDGIVCGSSWVPSGPLTGMTFEPCDNSVTITSANSCATFTLTIGPVIGVSCPANSTTFTICHSNEPVITATPSACTPATGLYSLSGTVTIGNPLATGTMTVSISGGGPSQVFASPLSTTTNYSFTGLNANASTQTLTVSFNNAASCAASVPYAAPAFCGCVTGNCLPTTVRKN